MKPVLNKVDWFSRSGPYLSALPPLLMRCVLALYFMQSGWYKLDHYEASVQWFGNDDWGLGLPFAEQWVSTLSSVEVLCGLFLLFGLATRFVAIPLILILLVGLVSLHIQNGWQWVAESDLWLGGDRILQAEQRLEEARNILKTYGDYDYLTEYGPFVILNNGIERHVIHLTLLLSLLVSGGGRFVSLDYWIEKWWGRYGARS